MKRHPDARMLLGVEVLLDLDSFSSVVFNFFSVAVMVYISNN